MAVFVRSVSEGRLHCEVIAYFSPAAADVAKTFDGQPCPKPAREGLGLLAGLAFVNRMDSVLLYVPALVWITARAARESRARVIPIVLAFTLPYPEDHARAVHVRALPLAQCGHPQPCGIKRSEDGAVRQMTRDGQ